MFCVIAAYVLVVLIYLSGLSSLVYTMIKATQSFLFLAVLGYFFTLLLEGVRPIIRLWDDRTQQWQKNVLLLTSVQTEISSQIIN